MRQSAAALIALIALVAPLDAEEAPRHAHAMPGARVAGCRLDGGRHD